MSTDLTFKISEEFYQAIKLPATEVSGRLKRELAVRLYTKGLLTLGKARELAEMTRWDFHELLGEEEVPRRYDVDELDEDLATLAALE